MRHDSYWKNSELNLWRRKSQVKYIVSAVKNSLDIAEEKVSDLEDIIATIESEREKNISKSISNLQNDLRRLPLKGLSWKIPEEENNGSIMTKPAES